MTLCRFNCIFLPFPTSAIGFSSFVPLSSAMFSLSSRRHGGSTEPRAMLKKAPILSCSNQGCILCTYRGYRHRIPFRFETSEGEGGKGLSLGERLLDADLHLGLYGGNTPPCPRQKETLTSTSPLTPPPPHTKMYTHSTQYTLGVSPQKMGGGGGGEEEVHSIGMVNKPWDDLNSMRVREDLPYLAVHSLHKHGGGHVIGRGFHQLTSKVLRRTQNASTRPLLDMGGVCAVMETSNGKL